MSNTFNKTCSSNDVQTLRSEMIKSGMAKGLNHPTTIKLSKKLDKLLNEWL